MNNPSKQAIVNFLAVMDRIIQSKEVEEFSDDAGYGSMDWQTLEEHGDFFQVVDWLREQSSANTMSEAEKLAMEQATRDLDREIANELNR